jgi:hypothetical protein
MTPHDIPTGRAPRRRASGALPIDAEALRLRMLLPRPARPLVAAALFAPLTACFALPPDPVVVECLNGCARQKDACLVGATSADGIQRCDGQSLSCNAGCER